MALAVKEKLAKVPKPVWYGIGFAAVLLLLMRRKGVQKAASSAAASVSKAVGDAAFKLALPAEGQRYADDILRVAKEEGISPFVIAVLMEQESGYGTALSTHDHTGTGDGGHGHGLMQIDDRTFGAGQSDPWLTYRNRAGTPLWQIPYENIKKGVEGLKWQLAYFGKVPKPGPVNVKAGSAANKAGAAPGAYPDPRPLSGDRLLFAAIAAYNTGQGNVLQALAAGLPADATTAKTRTGSGVIGYATSVLARLSDLTARAG